MEKQENKKLEYSDADLEKIISDYKQEILKGWENTRKNLPKEYTAHQIAEQIVEDLKQVEQSITGDKELDIRIIEGIAEEIIRRSENNPNYIKIIKKGYINWRFQNNALIKEVAKDMHMKKEELEEGIMPIVVERSVKDAIVPREIRKSVENYYKELYENARDQILLIREKAYRKSIIFNGIKSGAINIIPAALAAIELESIMRLHPTSVEAFVSQAAALTIWTLSSIGTTESAIWSTKLLRKSKNGIDNKDEDKKDKG
ncbi:MAG: hypothetical protein ACP5LP_00685 [Candidatus Micrarchaeia archaeon]